MGEPENPFDDLGENPGKKKSPETNFTSPAKLTPEEGERIKALASEGKGVNKIARTLKRSPATVSRAFKKLHISKAVALFKAGRMVDEKVNAAQQLKKINQKANKILYETDPQDPDIVLKAMAEIRCQLKLQLEIFQALYNLEEAAKWQELLMTILGKVALMLGMNSTVATKSLALYDNFGGEFKPQFRAEDRNASLDNWVLASKIILDGKVFCFVRQEYLQEPYANPHPQIVEEKARQLGLTVKAAMGSIHGSTTGKYPHLFASRSDVTEFSKASITLLIVENEDTIACWILETDSANLKQIVLSFPYLHGMQSRVGLKKRNFTRIKGLSEKRRLSGLVAAIFTVRGFCRREIQSLVIDDGRGLRPPEGSGGI